MGTPRLTEIFITKEITDRLAVDEFGFQPGTSAVFNEFASTTDKTYSTRPVAGRQQFQKVPVRGTGHDAGWFLALICCGAFSKENRKNMSPDELRENLSDQFKQDKYGEYTSNVAIAFMDVLPYSEGFKRELIARKEQLIHGLAGKPALQRKNINPRSAQLSPDDQRFAPRNQYEFEGFKILRHLIDKYKEEARPEAEKTRSGYVDKEAKVVLKLDGGYNWVQLENERQTKIEGGILQNCLRLPGKAKEFVQVYSLRDSNFEPHVIIAVDKNWNITEVKGKQNDTPDRKYWKHTLAMIKKLQLPVTDQGIDSDFRDWLNQNAQQETDEPTMNNVFSSKENKPSLANS